MKYIICAVLLVSLTRAQAQTECIAKPDRITGRTDWQSDPLVIAENGNEFGTVLSGLPDVKSMIWIMNFQGKQQMCFDKGSIVYILFRNGERMQIYCDLPFNCDGKFSIYFGNIYRKKKELKKLMEHPIEALKLVGFKGANVDQAFTEEDSEKLRRSFICMAENAKVKL